MFDGKARSPPGVVVEVGVVDRLVVVTVLPEMVTCCEVAPSPIRPMVIRLQRPARFSDIRPRLAP